MVYMNNRLFSIGRETILERYQDIYIYEKNGQNKRERKIKDLSSVNLIEVLRGGTVVIDTTEEIIFYHNIEIIFKKKMTIESNEEFKDE